MSLSAVETFMEALFEDGEFLEVWQAGAHVAGLQPGVAPALAAVGANLAARAFVVCIRRSLLHSLLEDLPSFFHRAFPEIVLWDGKPHTQVHLAIGGDREAAAAACAGDEGAAGGWAGLLDEIPANRTEPCFINADFGLRAQTVSQGAEVAVGLGDEIQAVLALEAEA